MRTPQTPSLHHLLQGWLGHWRALLWPAPILTTPKERLRAALGAGLGLLFMAALCQHMAPSWPGSPWMIAPLGASAVLVFAVPAGLDAHEAVASRLRQLLRATAGATSEKAEVVGQIMTRQVRVASAHRPLMDLVPLFTDGGHHHIPIVGEHRKLVGIITQSDFLQAWSRAVQDGWQTEAVK